MGVTQNMNTTQRRRDKQEQVNQQISFAGDIFVFCAMCLATVFALALFMSVTLATYGRLAIADGNSATPGFLARVVSVVDGAGITGGIARGLVMLVLFGVSVALMRGAHRVWRVRLARVFSWVYVVFAFLLMIAGVLLFHAYPFAARDYFILIAVALCFTVFSAILAGVGGAEAYLSYFAASFVVVALLNIILFVFSRNVALDGLFAGRMGLFAVIGMIASIYGYAGKMIEAIRS